MKADALAAFLNDLLDVDREAIERLVESRVPCSNALADHPHVITLSGDFGTATVGLIGILNGMLSADGGSGDVRLVAHFSDADELERFAAVSLEDFKE